MASTLDTTPTKSTPWWKSFTKSKTSSKSKANPPSNASSDNQSAPKATSDPAAEKQQASVSPSTLADILSVAQPPLAASVPRPATPAEQKPLEPKPAPTPGNASVQLPTEAPASINQPIQLSATTPSNVVSLPSKQQAATPKGTPRVVSSQLASSTVKLPGPNEDAAVSLDDCYFDIKIRTERKWWKSDAEADKGGRIVFKLDDQRLPVTCKNFRDLCKDDQYAQFVFHEVSRDYMQSGAITFGKHFQGRPLGDMREVRHANDKLVSHDKPYLLSALRGSSKFVITCDPATWLDGDYVVFGEVTQGREFVKSTIEDYGTISRRPKADIVVLKCGLESEVPPTQAIGVPNTGEPRGLPNPVE